LFLSGVVGMSNLTELGNGASVHGKSRYGYGVYGESVGSGVVGSGTNTVGTYGESMSGYGLQGISAKNFGLYAHSDGDLAAFLDGNVSYR
jgi:hypothetical protein